MKEYKYKINGNIYKVGIGDIDHGIAEVEVNGTPYKVELEQKAAPTIKVATPKPAAAPRTASGEKVIAKPAAKALQAEALSKRHSPAWFSTSMCR